MVHFRRNYSHRGIYFFTVTLRDRHSDLLIKQINILRDSINKVKSENPFKIHALVILPDHLHALWQLPDEDINYSQRWRKIKGYFTHELKSNGAVIKMDNRGEHLIWQRRFWEHTILNEPDYENHINYIHYNPVKHGLVKQVCDWPHSTFHHYVKKGILDEDWAGVSSNNISQKFGE